MAENIATTDLETYLDGLLLPASKNEVVHKAKKNGAPKEVWKKLDKELPWLTFQHFDDIVSNLGQPQK